MIRTVAAHLRRFRERQECGGRLGVQLLEVCRARLERLGLAGCATAPEHLSVGPPVRRELVGGVRRHTYHRLIG
jgi:hypothetical protein